MGVERSDASGVPLRQRRHLIGRPEQPGAGMIGVLLNGIIGIVSEPARLAQSTLLLSDCAGLVQAKLLARVKQLTENVSVVDLLTCRDFLK